MVSQPTDSASCDFPNHLLGTESLSLSHATDILALAKTQMAVNRKEDKKNPLLAGRTLINLFFENSTRTRTSFEIAGKRLGMDVMNISADASSVKKGESLLDTAETLKAMQTDCLVIRHPRSGTAKLLAEHVSCPIINAGDGTHERPTQALLDALTIETRKGTISGLTVAICGDILHSRVARSNAWLLRTLGANVRLIAPPPLMPLHAEVFGAECTHNMKEGLAGADVVMMLRLQHERMASAAVPSVREYFHLYGLDRAKLSLAKPDAIVMHPGPMNRGVEIDSAIADDVKHSVILEQVELGVAMRQAIMLALLTPKQWKR